MRRTVIAVWFAVLALQACSTPADPPRICAEWEPAIGTMIAWQLEVPRQLVELLAAEETLYVLVADQEHEESARAVLTSQTPDPSSVGLETV